MTSGLTVGVVGNYFELSAREIGWIRLGSKTMLLALLGFLASKRVSCIPELPFLRCLSSGHRYLGSRCLLQHSLGPLGTLSDFAGALQGHLL